MFFTIIITILSISNKIAVILFTFSLPFSYADTVVNFGNLCVYNINKTIEKHNNKGRVIRKKLIKECGQFMIDRYQILYIESLNKHQAQSYPRRESKQQLSLFFSTFFFLNCSSRYNRQLSTFHLPLLLHFRHRCHYYYVTIKPMSYTKEVLLRGFRVINLSFVQLGLLIRVLTRRIVKRSTFNELLLGDCFSTSRFTLQLECFPNIEYVASIADQIFVQCSWYSPLFLVICITSMSMRVTF